MLNLGSTTLPLAGWLADPLRPDESRAQRLLSIRQLVQSFGLSAVELTADLGVVYPQVFNDHYYAAVADLQQELGFCCSVHLPFLWVDLCSLNEPARQTSVATMQQMVAAVSPVEVRTFVLHLWGSTVSQITIAFDEPSQSEPIVAGLLAQGRRSLEQVCETVDPHRICVENLEDSLFDRAWPLLAEMETSICLDVGHLAGQGRDTLDFLASYGNHIAEVHLHDAAWQPASRVSVVRDHLALGQGHVDYGALLKALQERGFDGPIIVEVNSRADLEQSVVAVRRSLGGDC
jgi:sugar phosphate isomerase/epimerase